MTVAESLSGSLKSRPFEVTFKPKTSIKSQVLADFIAKFTSEPPQQRNPLEGWVFNVDGVSNSKGANIVSAYHSR